MVVFIEEHRTKGKVMDYKIGSDYKYVGADTQLGLAGETGRLDAYFGDVGSLYVKGKTWSVKLHNLVEAI